MDSACAICDGADDGVVGVSTLGGVVEVVVEAFCELSSFVSVLVVFGSSFTGDEAEAVDEADAEALAFFTITTINFFSSTLYDDTVFSSSKMHPTSEESMGTKKV